MDRIVWILTFSLLLSSLSIKAQDDEEDEEDEDEEEETGVNAKEESGKLTDAPEATTQLSLEQVNNLTQLLRQSGGNSSTNQALMSMLLLAALTNNNAGNSNGQAALAAEATTLAEVTTAAPEVETEEPSSTTREEYVTNQIGRIMDSIMRGNISGIVDNAVRIGAPPSVIVMMGNIMNTLNNWTGGVFGIPLTTPPPTIDCGGPPPRVPARRQPDAGQASRPRPIPRRPPISPAASGGSLRTG